MRDTVEFLKRRFPIGARVEVRVPGRRVRHGEVVSFGAKSGTVRVRLDGLARSCATHRFYHEFLHLPASPVVSDLALGKHQGESDG